VRGRKATWYETRGGARRLSPLPCVSANPVCKILLPSCPLYAQILPSEKLIPFPQLSTTFVKWVKEARFFIFMKAKRSIFQGYPFHSISFMMQ